MHTRSASVVGNGPAFHAGVNVREHHLGFGNHCARRVLYGAMDGGRGRLCDGRYRQDQNEASERDAGERRCDAAERS